MLPSLVLISIPPLTFCGLSRGFILFVLICVVTHLTNSLKYITYFYLSNRIKINSSIFEVSVLLPSASHFKTTTLEVVNNLCVKCATLVQLLKHLIAALSLTH